MCDCDALIKAIDAYIAKADEDLKNALNGAGFADPNGAVKEISSLEEKVTEVLTAETTYITSKISQAKDLPNLYYGDLWDEIKNGDTTAEELAAVFGDEFMAYIPELAGEYIRQADPELSVNTITERTNSWINVWSITLGLIMAFNFHRNVENSIIDGIINGLSISMFAQNMKDKPIRDDYHNARLVSMTEILRAHSVANQEAIMQNPAVEYKEWVHAGVFQTKPRENHVAMNGVTARKDEPFQLLGADGSLYNPMYPRDSNLPPEESINCHCMHRGAVNENVFGLPLEERKRMQEEAIAADNEKFTQENVTNGENTLTNPDNNGIIEVETGSENNMNENMSGGISGALDPESKEAEIHAEQYYESVRNMKNDYINIAKNTGFSENDIKEIKNYLFVDKHELTDGYKRFRPYFEIAQSWQRLESGINIREQDIILLNHELTELRLVKSGISQDDAHIEASKIFNYRKAIEKEE